MSIRQEADGFYADAIFAHGESDANDEVAVFDLIGTEKQKVEIGSVEAIEAGRHRCGRHNDGADPCVWRKYDLRKRNI